jgi:hypothetical protein
MQIGLAIASSLKYALEVIPKYDEKLTCTHIAETPIYVFGSVVELTLFWDCLCQCKSKIGMTPTPTIKPTTTPAL